MFVGLVVIVLIVIGIIGYAMYSLIGELTPQGIHLLATGLTFAVLGAYWLGLQVARSHKAGFKQGIDLKLTARERMQQTARSSTATTQPYKPQHDDLLPRVGTMQIIDASPGRGEIVD
jgi:hypothetical protein